MKILKPAIIIALLMCITAPVAQAAWPAILWDGFKVIAIDTAIDVVQDLFKEKVTPQEVAALSRRISELNTQLAEYKNQATPSDEYDTIQQMIASLNNIVNMMDNRMSSVEERVGKLENELSSLRQALLDTKPAPLDFKINYVYRSDGKGNFKPLTSGSTLRSGDHYKIIFTPVEDCHVSIFQVDSANMLYRLFPMKKFGKLILNNNNPVQAGKTYYIPTKNSSFVLDEQTGTETIFFVASRQNDVVLEKQYQALRQQQDDIARTQQAQVQLIQTLRSAKGMATITADPNNNQIAWQEKGEDFSTSPRILPDLCNGCVNILTFEHTW
ncbi:MAG: DUF4384 domain-containing protein [Pseudomonadota bacterium]